MEPEKTSSDDSLFQKPDEGAQGGMSRVVWVVVSVVVVALAAALLLTERHRQREQKPVDATAQAALDPYAANLPITGLVMSEAGSFAGGKLTYIDGHIRNTGQKTVTGITVQTIFRNDVGELPQVETLPLMLIRTRDPYVDTQPVSATPLKPGDDREFRLIFEHVTPNWNQQYPEVHVIRVEAK